MSHYLDNLLVLSRTHNVGQGGRPSSANPSTDVGKNRMCEDILGNIHARVKSVRRAADMMNEEQVGFSRDMSAMPSV